MDSIDCFLECACWFVNLFKSLQCPWTYFLAYWPQMSLVPFYFVPVLSCLITPYVHGISGQMSCVSFPIVEHAVPGTTRQRLYLGVIGSAFESTFQEYKRGCCGNNLLLRKMHLKKFYWPHFINLETTDLTSSGIIRSSFSPHSKNAKKTPGNNS